MKSSSSYSHIPVTTAGALTPITQNAPATLLPVNAIIRFRAPFNFFFLLLIAATLTRAAEPLRNTGSPMTLPFKCTAEDIAQAGLTCSEDAPCPVYLELSSAASLGNKLFVAGNLHTESANLYSVFLESDDEGASWTEPGARIRGADLDQIQFPDFEHGWISGGMLQPMARDPFFFITSDGAKSWQRKPLFEDGTAGSIYAFWFDSRNHGMLVLDKGSGSSRYELYESPTGGETWTIRESSAKPILIKSMPPPGTGGWRVRADGKAHVYMIEKASGENWKPVAGFLVRVGSCKPGEPEADVK